MAPEIMRVGVIMAGGSGERFWPLSRRNHPKQLLRLTNADASMLHEAVDRLAPLIPPEHLYVQTMEHLVSAIRQAHVGVPPENVLAEPCKRNTAGCLVYAAAHLQAKYQLPPEQLSMAIVTADHIIGAPERFRRTVTAALEAAERDPVLVTIGMETTRPATGFGYIQTVSTPHPYTVTAVRAFHEKPSLETARRYAADPHFFWNGGMFFWRVSTFLEELEKARPEMAATARRLAASMAQQGPDQVRAVFEELENISIDYALMEKSQQVGMVPAVFPWDDIGTWTALDRTREPDSAGNVSEGDTVLVDARNCIVYNDTESGAMPVAVVGAENLVVVVTKDAVLVVSKDHVEDVKKAVQELERRGASQL